MIHEQREQLAARVRASLGSEQIRYREEEISEASHVGNEVSRGRRDAEQLTRYRITWESREVACGWRAAQLRSKFKGGSCQPSQIVPIRVPESTEKVCRGGECLALFLNQL